VVDEGEVLEGGDGVGAGADLLFGRCDQFVQARRARVEGGAFGDGGGESGGALVSGIQIQGGRADDCEEDDDEREDETEARGAGGGRLLHGVGESEA
jgi:hypothetical protein